MVALVIRNEDDAWRLLKAALRGDAVDTDSISFEGWPCLHIHLDGRDLNANLPARYLPALQEYQESVQRVYSYLKYKEYGIRRLKDYERKELELVFHVQEGSSQVIADVKDALQAMANVMVGMTGKQKAIVICMLGLMISSNLAWAHWLTTKENISDISSQHSVAVELIEANKVQGENSLKQMEILSDALGASRYGRVTYDSVGDAHGRLISSMDDDDELIVGEARLPGAVLKEVTATPRATSQTYSAEGAATLFSAERASKGGFAIGVRMDDGEVFYAQIEDNRLVDEEIRTVRDALFNGQPIWVHIEGKLKRQKVKDAFIRGARPLTRTEQGLLVAN